jgi:hypothetical protein
MNFLQKQGYRLYNYSPFAISNLPPFYANVYLSEGVVASVNQTFESTLFMDILEECVKDLSGNLTNKILSNVLSVAYHERNYPIFVYAHLPVPHFPYVFDENGKEIGWFHYASHNNKSAYLRQIHGVNSLLIPFIDSLQAVSRRQSIIIIQGDHGFRLLPGKDQYLEMFTIMNAYYFPDRNYSGISQAISPYNTFRVILNKYFGTKISLLPDTVEGIRYRGSR